MKQKMTYHDVARAARVSVSTVSRVANGNGRVDSELRKRVQSAAKQLGFELRRKQRKHREKVMVFLLSNREMLHPFHSRILLGAESYCASHHKHILFLSFHYPLNAAWKQLAAPPIIESRELVAGFILAGTNSRGLFDLLTQKGYPFSVLGNNVVGEWARNESDVVWFDDVKGAGEVTRYLQSLGHRDIWYVGNCRFTWFRRRLEGYRKAMVDAGLPPRVSEFDLPDEAEVGYIAAKSILAQGEAVSAIFAGGDRAAQGVYKALADAGLRIPQDISVAGFNDTEAAVMNPPLTTIRAYPEQIGRHMAELLLNRLAQPDLPKQKVTIPTQLIKRESCDRFEGAARRAEGLRTAALVDE